MEKRITPVWITKLKPNEVFVFGSNLAGKHGAGAAKMAMQFGAQYGVGFGLRGQTLAIPTKDKYLRVLTLGNIDVYVEGSIIIMKNNPELNFLVTEIGTGLAGYTARQIAPMFKEAAGMKNVWLPDNFLKIIGA